MEMAEDNPIDQVLVPDEGSLEEIQPTVNDGGPEPGEESHPNASSGESPIDDAACTSASFIRKASLSSWDLFKASALSSKALRAADKLASACSNLERNSSSPLMRWETKAFM